MSSRHLTGLAVSQPTHGGALQTDPMGQTAENAAQLYGIGRAALDRFALASLQKVVAAQQEGRSSRS